MSNVVLKVRLRFWHILSVTFASSLAMLWLMVVVGGEHVKVSWVPFSFLSAFFQSIICYVVLKKWPEPKTLYDYTVSNFENEKAVKAISLGIGLALVVSFCFCPHITLPFVIWNIIFMAVFAVAAAIRSA